MTKWYVSLVIALAFYGVRRSCERLARGLGMQADTRPVVLTYHAVRKDEVDAFEEQIRYLAENVRTVLADESRNASATACVAVTFDDALQNTLSRVLAVTSRHRVPITVFVPTGFMGRATGWRSDCATPGEPGETVASAAVLRQAHHLGVRLGSHTVSHPDLATLSEQDCSFELHASRTALEELTGQSTRILALPYGGCSGEVLNAARRAGYELVFANVPVRTRVSSPLLIGRVNASPGDWPLEFRLKVCGAYQWLALALIVKRSLFRWFGRARVKPRRVTA